MTNNLLRLGNITRDRNLKQKLIRDRSDPVTGLAFKTTAKNIHLFVATVECVIQYNVTVKDKEEEVFTDFLFTHIAYLASYVTYHVFKIGCPG